MPTLLHCFARFWRLFGNRFDVFEEVWIDR
jgi:hypothetical protein